MWALVRRHVDANKIRLMQVRAVWPKIAGSALEAHTWPMGVAGEQLIVHVHDSQWLHELTYLRQDLVRRLATLAPTTALHSLRLRLGPVPPLADRCSEEPELPPPLPPPRLSPEPDEATHQALNAVRDPELKQLIAGARIMLGRP